MVKWIEPKFSKNQVSKAGDRYRNKTRVWGDRQIIENWRASHAYVLNTFQANLRGRTRGKKITVGQRLKRYPTILDKLLNRQNKMKLSRMNDVAGCRVIFEDEKAMANFRFDFHKSRSKHKLKKQYDYIRHPKPNGYRGIHDVYEYESIAQSSAKWKGLLVEIQYRTKYQHAWATAVEVADLTTSNRIKFDDARPEYRDFFKLASEIIARSFEDRTSCYPEMSDRELMLKFRWTDRKLGLMDKFKHLAQVKAPQRFRKNTILRFTINPIDGKRSLQIEGFDSVIVALDRYAELEAVADEFQDVVFVQAANRESMREAFKNYFSDTKEFSKYINKGLNRLAIKVLNSEMVERL